MEPSTESGIVPDTVTFELTEPTCEAVGQLSALSWSTVHSGVAVGSATWPGGRWTVSFFTESAPPKLIPRTKLLWAPAEVSVGWALRLVKLMSACAAGAWNASPMRSDP